MTTITIPSGTQVPATPLLDFDEKYSKPIEVASQLDLQPKTLSTSIYKYKRLNQINGGSKLSISSSASESVFNLPAECWNISRGFLTFYAAVPATAGRYNVLHTDVIPMDSISLTTSSGEVLAKLDNLPAFSKTVRFAMTPKKEFLSRGRAVMGDAAASIPDAYRDAFHYSHQCQPTDVMNINLGDLTNAATGTPKYIRHSGAVNTGSDNSSVLTYASVAGIAALAVADPPTQANVIAIRGALANVNAAAAAATVTLNSASYAEGHTHQGQVPQSIATAAVVNHVNVMKYKIDLKSFHGTLLALDKTMYFGGEILQLRINWSPKAQWGFVTDIDLTNVAELADFDINDYALFLPQDINQETATQLKTEVMTKGLKTLIPYTNSSNASSNAAGSFTVASQYTPNQGIALKRVFTVPVHNTNARQYAANCENVAAVKWSDVQSSLDAKPIQDLRIGVANGMAWQFLEPYFKESALLNEREYLIRAFWCDVFGSAGTSDQWDEDDTKESGLSLAGTTKQYEVNFTTVPAALKFYQYSTFVRNLTIAPTGISWSK